MQNHWKKHNHKIDTVFILGNPQGDEKLTKIPLYKLYRIKPQNMYSPPCWFVSLSPMRYSSEWVYVIMRNTNPLFIHFMSTDFYPKQVGPTKLFQLTSLRKTQNNILYYSLGYYWPNLQWRLYLMTLWWPITIITFRRRNNNIFLGVH